MHNVYVISQREDGTFWSDKLTNGVMTAIRMTNLMSFGTPAANYDIPSQGGMGIQPIQSHNLHSENQSTYVPMDSLNIGNWDLDSFDLGDVDLDNLDLGELGSLNLNDLDLI